MDTLVEIPVFQVVGPECPRDPFQLYNYMILRLYKPGDYAGPERPEAVLDYGICPRYYLSFTTIYFPWLFTDSKSESPGSDVRGIRGLIQARFFKPKFVCNRREEMNGRESKCSVLTLRTFLHLPLCHSSIDYVLFFSFCVSS